VSCSSCGGGLNQIVTLPVPGIDNTDGDPVDVSGLVGEKTIEIAGLYSGIYVVMGSHDAVRYSPILSFNSGGGAQSPKQTIDFVLSTMRVRRRATNVTAVSAKVASRTTCTC
jgi:hypothetical protein